MSSFTYHEVKQLIIGPAGSLEVRCESNEQAEIDLAAIICHPHPLFGGTLDNKVVTTLAKAYKDLGFKYVIRFNFRGVGASQGQYAEGKGEVEDLVAVVDWAKQYSPKFWLAGFSFGSFVATAAANRLNCQHLTCVAPPVVNFPFADLPTPTCPWLVVQGDKDEVVEPERVFSWHSSLENNPPQLIRLSEASHFFHGKLLELRAQLTQAFKNYL